MTKRILVLLPVIALALVFTGCSSGDSGAGSKAKAFDELSSDPVAEGLARGYVSTLVADYSGNAAYNSQVTQNGAGLAPVSRDVFQSPSLQGKAAPGQVGASTLAPSRSASKFDERYASAEVTAHAGQNDSIVLKFGPQTATIYPVSQNGSEYTFTAGANGVVTMNGGNEFPRVVEESGVGRAVVLVSGNVVPVQE